jgi:aspartate ammonia-lyase
MACRPRALENFQLSGVPINHYPGFIEAWAIVKLAQPKLTPM